MSVHVGIWASADLGEAVLLSRKKECNQIKTSRKRCVTNGERRAPHQ